MYLAIINPIGYLPETEPIEFDSTPDAWEYIIEELTYLWNTCQIETDPEDAIAIIKSDTQTDGTITLDGYAYTVTQA